MDEIKVIHDAVGHTLTVWLDDPGKEHVCEETTEEVVLMKDVLMKDVQGRVIGFCSESFAKRPARRREGRLVEPRSVHSGGEERPPRDMGLHRS